MKWTNFAHFFFAISHNITVVVWLIGTRSCSWVHTSHLYCRSNGKTINNKVFFLFNSPIYFPLLLLSMMMRLFLFGYVCDNMQLKWMRCFCELCRFALCMCATLRHVIFSKSIEWLKWKITLHSAESETRNKSVTIRGTSNHLPYCFTRASNSFSSYILSIR